MRAYYTYILASKRNGTLYVGMAHDLMHRVGQHKAGAIEGFTQKYQVHLLVWYEESKYVLNAIAREKQLKNWKRQWKIELIEKENPEWRDLYEE